MSDSGLPIANDEPRPGVEPSPSLSDQQRAFQQMLKGLRDGRLADWYLGAITVLNQKSNPDRFAQAAHSIRKILEKLPDEMELPIPKSPSTLGDRVNSLKAKWKRVKRHPEDITPDSGRLTAFLEILSDFFADFDNPFSTRKEIARFIQDELDPLGATMPRVLREERSNDWVTLRNYFVDVCHHKTDPEPQDFLANIAAVEAFLLDLANPKSVDNQAQILELIHEAEQDGHTSASRQGQAVNKNCR